MSSYLGISIRFLDATFHGRMDAGEPEWPPSPLRLFQALVAAAAARTRDSQQFPPACAPAFEFLQTRAAPTIITPREHVGTPFRIAVPNNDLDTLAKAWARNNQPRKGAAELKTMKTIRPVHLRGDNSLHYLFPIDTSDPEFNSHRDTLIDAARSITHLGWGVDMVAGNAAVLSDEEAINLPGERWQPTQKASANGLRVPIHGTLKDLAAKHSAFLNRLSQDGFNPVPPLSAFRVVAYRRATDPSPRPFAAFRLQHPVEDRAAVFSMTHANHVAAMTRNALARIAREQGRNIDWIDRYVHGHRQEKEPSLPRFSYLPLPSIQRRGERACVLGAIRRVLIAEPADSADSHGAWVRQMLPGAFLIDEKTSRRAAMLTPLTAGDWVLQQHTARADTWATVTPIVLPGSDDGKFAKAEKLFFKALRHAGHGPDALAEWDFRNVSFWPGGEPALRFHRPDYLKKGSWSMYHMRLRWKQPIQGPLALGAGRHCGLGILAKLD